MSEKRGCPEFCWDGPYRYRCGLGAEHGVCSVHGPFRDGKKAIGTEPQQRDPFLPEQTPSPDAQHIATAIREAAVTVSEAILAAGEGVSRAEIVGVVADVLDARDQQAHALYRAGAES